MREKDDGQYDLERGFLRATSWHVSPLQICYRRSILPLLNNFKALMKRQRHHRCWLK